MIKKLNLVEWVDSDSQIAEELLEIIPNNDFTILKREQIGTVSKYIWNQQRAEAWIDIKSNTTQMKYHLVYDSDDKRYFSIKPFDDNNSFRLGNDSMFKDVPHIKELLFELSLSDFGH